MSASSKYLCRRTGSFKDDFNDSGLFTEGSCIKICLNSVPARQIMERNKLLVQKWINIIHAKQTHGKLYHLFGTMFIAQKIIWCQFLWQLKKMLLNIVPEVLGTLQINDNCLTKCLSFITLNAMIFASLPTVQSWSFPGNIRQGSVYTSKTACSLFSLSPVENITSKYFYLVLFITLGRIN